MALTATPSSIRRNKRWRRQTADCAGAVEHYGMIDGKVNIRDREQVLEHYSKKSLAFTTAYIPPLKTMCREFKPTGKGTKPGSMS